MARPEKDRARRRYRRHRSPPTVKKERARRGKRRPRRYALRCVGVARSYGHLGNVPTSDLQMTLTTIIAVAWQISHKTPVVWDRSRQGFRIGNRGERVMIFAEIRAVEPVRIRELVA